MGKMRYSLIFLCIILLVGLTSAAVPVADFSASPLSGTAPLNVSFTDLSLNNPNGYAWFFGDETYKAPWNLINASPRWSARQDHCSVVMPDGSIVVMGGQDNSDFKNDVWRSTDKGDTWTLINASPGWTARIDHSCVVMADSSIILMGGVISGGFEQNDVWRSGDNGTTWVQQTAAAEWPARWGHTSVTMPDGSIILIGGYDGNWMNDVWRSTDNGTTWVQQTASAEWAPREGHTSVTMPDGSIVLMGGYPSVMNDVWRSTDNGATWIQVVEHANWTARYQHTSVVMPDGSIILMGGSAALVGVTNETWRSTDNGETWIRVNASSGWPIRGGHSTVAMPDGSIVLMGGWVLAPTGNGPKNDVWRFVPTGSSAQNPSHTYTKAGTYPVALQVYNSGGHNSTRKTGYITVTRLPDPVAGFNGTPVLGTVPLTVAFSDESIGSLSGWAWYFGDETYKAPWVRVNASPGWSQRIGHSSVVMSDGSIILMGGYGSAPICKNDVWRSKDNGTTWALVTGNPGWTGRYGHTSVAFPDSSIVLMGGFDSGGFLKNDVWRSTDNGETWTLVNANAGWSARYGHSSIVMPDGSIVLMGGRQVDGVWLDTNDVWRSTDKGTSWNLVNASAGWTPRSHHSSITMPDGSIVLMGGGKNDVWRSTDIGATWVLVNASAGWSERGDQSSVAMPDGSIVLMGGCPSIPVNDTWRSKDNGATWELLNVSAGWARRCDHTSVATPDGSIVLMGGVGIDRYQIYYNDVWRFQPAGSTSQNPSHTYNTPGTYQVTLQVYNTVGYNSTRKTGYITVQGVDFLPTEFGAVGQANVIDGIPIGWKVQNRGNVEFVGNRTDAVYLSKDQFLNAGDIKLSSFAMNRSLSPGESHSISKIIDYSNPVQDGIYYLILNIDDQNDFAEQNEQNNAIFRPIRIGSEEPFNETAAHQLSLNEDLKSQNLTSDNGQVTGDLSGTFNLTSVDLVTITSGSFKGQGFFKAIITANLESLEYSGNLNGVIVPDPKNNRILLKGTISGSDMAGLVDGTLTESIPGSGMYDHFSAEWKLNRIQEVITTSTLHADSDLSVVDEHSYSSVPLTVIQTSMTGTTFGDYEQTISAVITHLHISDPSNPSDGNGFSTLSYNSVIGQGQGWTYDNVVASDFIDMRGAFTSPLESVVSGTITPNPPRSLSIFLERIDLGLPILPDLKVSVSGPQRVSPGQTVDYIIEVRNDGFATAHDVVVVDALPREFEYISSSSGGMYRWENNEVFWIFDTFAPRSQQYLYIRGTVPWGLSEGLQLNHTVYAETTDDERDTYPDKKTAVCSLDQYREYQQGDAIEIVPLSIEENEVIRNTQNYQDILAYAISSGYIDTNTSSQMIMPDGSEVTLSLLMSPDPVENPEMVFITRFMGSDGLSTDWFLYKLSNSSISLFDREGGIAFNINDGTTAYLGNWGEMHSCPRGACRINCYWNELRLALVGCYNFKSPVGDFFGKSLGSVTTSIDCIKCKNLPAGLDRYDSCSRCAISLIGAFPGMRWPGCGASLAFEMFRCEGVCRNPGTSPEYSNMNCNPGDFQSTCSRTWNIEDIWAGKSIAIPKVITEKCTFDCRWEVSGTQTCVSSDPNKKCDCMTTADGTTGCGCDNPNKGETRSIATTARDPNIKYGPEGHVLAGQTLDYRIEYENVGEGIAFGVYFIDTLDEDLDDSSLIIGPVYSTADGSQIAPVGTYNPTTRTITWLIGEVEPHKGGYANISVKVRNDAPDDTEIINYGIVYFPSVPEETRTNAIISVVGVNHPPAAPANPAPSNNNAAATTTTGLVWTGSDPDGDTLRYDVYFGNTSPLPLLERDTFSTLANPGALTEDASYSWQVIARDPDGAETPGPVWQFTTGSAKPPVIPLPGYTVLPTDPDDDGIYEDLNGNDRLDFADVVLYFNQMEWIAANEPVNAFDLNGNDRVDFADIVQLFGEI